MTAQSTDDISGGGSKGVGPTEQNAIATCISAQNVSTNSAEVKTVEGAGASYVKHYLISPSKQILFEGSKIEVLLHCFDNGYIVKVPNLKKHKHRLKQGYKIRETPA